MSNPDYIMPPIRRSDVSKENRYAPGLSLDDKMALAHVAAIARIRHTSHLRTNMYRAYLPGEEEARRRRKEQEDLVALERRTLLSPVERLLACLAIAESNPNIKTLDLGFFEHRGRVSEMRKLQLGEVALRTHLPHINTSPSVSLDTTTYLEPGNIPSSDPHRVLARVDTILAETVPYELDVPQVDPYNPDSVQWDAEEVVTRLQRRDMFVMRLPEVYRLGAGLRDEVEATIGDARERKLASGNIHYQRTYEISSPSLLDEAQRVMSGEPSSVLLPDATIMFYSRSVNDVSRYAQERERMRIWLARRYFEDLDGKASTIHQPEGTWGFPWER